VLDSFKEMVLDVIYQVSDFKKVVFTKNPELLKQLIDTLCNVVSITKTSTDDEATLQDSTLQLIESLCVCLPKKKIYKLIMANILTMINHSSEEH
jgi:hypothetical protein